MRIKTVRISGFRPIPFTADYFEPSRQGELARIEWHKDAFQVAFALKNPFLNAIIGPNSSGKSSVFYALDLFFSNKVRLPKSWYNEKKTDKPIIIEVVFRGEGHDDAWCHENCIDNGDGTYDLTVAYIWRWDASRQDSSRLGLIYQGTGYRKIKKEDKERLDELFPEYRLLPAHTKWSDEASIEKNDLLFELIRFILEGQANIRRRSIIHKLQRSIEQLKQLARRESAPNSSAWREIEDLEKLLSEGINSITPGKPSVRIDVESAIPDLTSIFTKGKIYIDDGAELDFSEHGMGLQRSLVASILHAWHETVARQRLNKNYVFAIEEPELYLHPHATRVFIKTLEKLAEFDQVIFSTHSDIFVNHIPLENVINIRRVGNQRKIVVPDLSSLKQKEKAKVHRYLREHRSDMLFARAVLLVEGASELYAIPAFATKLRFDLDKSGVSVVFVNGKGNFKVYHQILEAFDIPHVLLVDGDGNPDAIRNAFRTEYGVSIYVLDEDFEYEVVGAISDEKFLKIYNEARKRIGKPKQNLEELSLDLTPDNLQRSWWESIKEKLNATIKQEYRSEYDEQKQEIQDLLGKIAEQVIQNGHLLPNARRKRQADLLQKLGKPYVGSVVGELMTYEEIKRMPKIVEAINAVIELSKL